MTRTEHVGHMPGEKGPFGVKRRTDVSLGLQKEWNPPTVYQERVSAAGKGMFQLGWASPRERVRTENEETGRERIGKNLGAVCHCRGKSSRDIKDRRNKGRDKGGP